MSNRKSSHHPTKRKKSKKKKSQLLSKEDVRIQIISLLEQADEAIKTDLDMAQKLAQQARKIQMRTRIKFPPEWKKRFCKHCKAFLYPGINCRIRLSSTNKVVTILCFQCNKYSRIPYYLSKEKKNERHD